MTKDPVFDVDTARRARLAAALRENLLRRKLRDRTTSDPPAQGERVED